MWSVNQVSVIVNVYKNRSVCGAPRPTTIWKEVRRVRLQKYNYGVEMKLKGKEDKTRTIGKLRTKTVGHAATMRTNSNIVLNPKKALLAFVANNHQKQAIHNHPSVTAALVSRPTINCK